MFQRPRCQAFTGKHATAGRGAGRAGGEPRGDLGPCLGGTTPLPWLFAQQVETMDMVPGCPAGLCSSPRYCVRSPNSWVGSCLARSRMSTRTRVFELGGGDFSQEEGGPQDPGWGLDLKDPAVCRTAGSLRKSQPTSSWDPTSAVPRDISHSFPRGRHRLRSLHPRKKIELDSKISAPSCSLCPSPMPDPGPAPAACSLMGPPAT